MNIEIRCIVSPTEDQNLVHKAISNLFPMLPITSANDEIFARTDDQLVLDWLRARIFEQRIIDVVRTRLLANLSGLSTILQLDKQFALTNKVRVIDDDEEPPLGAIRLRLSFTDEFEFHQFLHWFTPPTVDGRVVSQ